MQRVLVTSLVVCSAALLSVVSLGLLLQINAEQPPKSAAAPTQPSDLGPPKVARKVPSPAPAPEGTPDPLALQSLTLRLAPLHRPMDNPQPGDWVTQHDEAGQTFVEYLEHRPVHARGKRRVIYIQPLGYFEASEVEVLNLTARFLGQFFCLPVQIMKRIPLDVIPSRARRKHRAWGVNQILAPHVLYELLKPRLPADAATLLALTPNDLWPGQGWNFVFGMADLRDRVGVWSTYRNGDPVKERKRHLLRTFKIASHETGHMFSMRHCTAHECGMCGSNSRAESDRRPLEFCPPCLAKLLWATGCDARARYQNLANLMKEAGLNKQAARYKQLGGRF